MAAVASFARAARHLCAERSRRGAGDTSLDWLVALLAAVGAIRHLANAYLAGLVGPRLPPSSEAAFLIASAWTLLAYASTAGAARACRSTAVLLTHPRFRAAPLPRSALAGVITRIAVLRPGTAALAGLFAGSLAAALLTWGGRSVPVAGLLALGAAGTGAFVCGYAALAASGLTERSLGFVEVAAMLALVYANPDVRVADGALSVVALQGAVACPATAATACLTLAAAPASIAIASAAARLLRRRRSGGGRRSASAPVSPVARLYRADLPAGLLAVSFVVEGALVLGSTLQAGTLRGVSAAFLAVRMGWYAAFLLRTEYRLAGWRPAAILVPRQRLLYYLRSAPIHLALCAAPALLYAARAALAR